MAISPDKHHPELDLFLLLTDPRSCKEIKTDEEFERLNLDPRGHENPKGMHRMLEVFTGTDVGHMNFEQFLKFLAVSKKGQRYHSEGHGIINFAVLLGKLKAVSGDERKRLEARYDHLVNEHKENFHEVLEDIIEDLVEATHT